jgi:hypothetical protein
VAKHDNRSNCTLTAALETRLNQCRAHAPTLIRAQYGHRSKAQHVQFRVLAQRDRTEHDVTYYLLVLRCDKGNQRLGSEAKGVNNIGFHIGPEGSQIHFSDRAAVARRSL